MMRCTENYAFYTSERNCSIVALLALILFEIYVVKENVRNVNVE